MPCCYWWRGYISARHRSQCVRASGCRSLDRWWFQMISKATKSDKYGGEYARYLRSKYWLSYQGGYLTDSRYYTHCLHVHTLIQDQESDQYHVKQRVSITYRHMQPALFWVLIFNKCRPTILYRLSQNVKLIVTNN